MRGLFAGYGSFLLRDLPFDAIEFVAYEQLKRSYKASLTEAREPNSLETSAIGEACYVFSMTDPLSHCSCLQQLHCRRARLAMAGSLLPPDSPFWQFSWLGIAGLQVQLLGRSQAW